MPDEVSEGSSRVIAGDHCTLHTSPGYNITCYQYTVLLQSLSFLSLFESETPFFKVWIRPCILQADML